MSGCHNTTREVSNGSGRGGEIIRHFHRARLLWVFVVPLLLVYKL